MSTRGPWPPGTQSGRNGVSVSSPLRKHQPGLASKAGFCEEVTFAVGDEQEEEVPQREKRRPGEIKPRSLQFHRPTFISKASHLLAGEELTLSEPRFSHP